MPQERGVPTGGETPEEEESYETRLYTCQGKRVVRLKQVWFPKLNSEKFVIGAKIGELGNVSKYLRVEIGH